MASQQARAGRAALAVALLAGGTTAAFIWWPVPPQDGQALPSAPGAVAARELAPAPLPVAATAAEEARATMPQVRIPPGSAGKDTFAAALAAARTVPPPPAPPAIAEAKSFEEAIAAMRAARGEAPPAAAAVSPFGVR